MAQEGDDICSRGLYRGAKRKANLISCSNIFPLSLPESSRRLLCQGTPHVINSMKPTAYSQGGSLFSELKVDSVNDSTLASVGVIAHSWPAWATVFSITRLRLRWIMLVQNDLSEAVQLAFPDVLVLDLLQVDWDKLPRVDIVGFNGFVDGFDLPFPFGSMMIWDSEIILRSKSHIWSSDWKISREKLNHATCGGVSDFDAVIVVALHKSSASFPMPTSFKVECPSTDLSSILDPKRSGLHVPGILSLPLASSLAVHHLADNIYHHQGLYPSRILAPRIRAPYLFNESRFVVRPLVVEELLQVKDAPPLLFERLTKVGKQQVASLLAVPIKILAAVVTSVVLLTGLCIGGGRSLGGRIFQILRFPFQKA